MVLADDNFASIEAAVEEGRGVFDNLTKFIVWIIPTNLGEALTLFTAILLGLPLPLLPLQLLWINLTDTLLGLSLAFEPKERDVMSRPPRQPKQRLLTFPLIMRTGLVSLMMLAGGLGLFLWELRVQHAGLAVARTVAVNTIVLVQLIYLFNCRSLNHSLFAIGLFTNRWTGIKARADRALKKLSPLFDDLYSQEGRPSIPPEQLLKSRVLMALFSVRSDRSFCEQLGYNLLWLWFLDRELDEGSFDPTVFTHNYERVLSAEAAKLFFVEIYDLSREEGWTSSEHFTADGTLIEAWASFRGEKRTNQTHQSTTDPEAVLYRKGKGQESKLCFGAHVLMENRHGLCAAITVHNPIAEPEPAVALAQVDEVRELHEARIATVGADKAYHQKRFVQGCRERGISPHVACKDNQKVAGLDGRTTGATGYSISQRLRKRVEEIFGWMKTVGSCQSDAPRSSCRIIWRGLAPRAVLTPISLERVTPLAKSMLAIFTQAINSTHPTVMEKNTQVARTPA